MILCFSIFTMDAHDIALRKTALCRFYTNYMNIFYHVTNFVEV